MRLMQTWFGFEQDVIDAATEQARNRDTTPQISQYKAHDPGPFRWSYDTFDATLFGNVSL